MKHYIDLGKKLISEGYKQDTRTGWTRSLTGEKLDFDLRDGFPLLTTKYINIKHIIHETLWYLMGTDSIKYLKDNNINIWNLWADENDSIGPTYGVQWRNFEGVDQIKNVISDINKGGHRRLIVNGWNPLRLEEMALPPCLVMIQFHVVGDRLDATVYQRSGDYCLGVPYDIAEMALLTTMIAKTTGKQPGKLTMFYGDLHIYENHINTFGEQIKQPTYDLPQLLIEDRKHIDGYTFDDFTLSNYTHGPKYRFKVAK